MKFFPLLLPLLVLPACVPPKAIVVDESTLAPPGELPAVPAPGLATVTPVEPVPALPPQPVAEPPLPRLPQDDKMRMPDMLALPKEGDFRATRPSVPAGGDGAVIARPPTDPPPRVKPPAD